jgi:hypothetical protein
MSFVSFPVSLASRAPTHPTATILSLAHEDTAANKRAPHGTVIAYTSVAAPLWESCCDTISLLCASLSERRNPPGFPCSCVAKCVYVRFVCAGLLTPAKLLRSRPTRAMLLPPIIIPS